MSAHLRHQLADLLESMSPQEYQELRDVGTYLGGIAHSKNSTVPEGNVVAVINKQPPRIRTAIIALSNIIENVRDMPFELKRDEVRMLSDLGFDPVAGVMIKGAIDGLEVAGKLEQKMGGTDIQNGYHKRPATLREQIEASASIEEPQARATAHADKAAADAGRETNLPLRTHIELASNVIGANRDLDT